MKKYISTVGVILLVLFTVLGCGRSGTAAASGGTSAGSSSGKAWENIPTGYYNLADFEARQGAKIGAFKEAPSLASQVSSGALPPVEQRLPDNPAVFRTLNVVGEYGGTMRITNINIGADWHLRHINSGNLIEQPANAAWDVASTVFGVEQQPGILESFGMSPDGKVFTATIRKGIKWSDGVPVTTKDVEFKVKDILLNTELNPVPANWLVWGNGKTEITIIDDYTFSFTFAQPYGAFIEAEVSLWPGTFDKLILPKHYLEKYHKAYNSQSEIMKYMAADDVTNFTEWSRWFIGKHNFWGNDGANLDTGGKILPTLDPWCAVEDLGNGNYKLERNPYFYMVDQDGNQLPYIDYISSTYVSDQQVDNMAILSGQVDVSAMSLGVPDYPLFKENEDRGNYYCLPLPHMSDQVFITLFNGEAGIRPPTITSITGAVAQELPSASQYDPGLAEIYEDVRFRRAMSLALNRQVFNDSLFMGLGRPAQAAPRPTSPYYKEGMEESWAAYDPEQAKTLLDEIGMKDINGDGWREQPNGRPFTVKYDYFVITAASTPGAELCKRFWEEVGVKVDLRLVDVGYWGSNLQGNNLNEATTWWLSGSNANLLQDWFLGPSMITPLWGRYTQYINSTISRDEWENKVLPYVPEWQREMQDLRIQIKSEPDRQKQREIGIRIWELQAEWLPIIGVVTDIPTPFIISKDMGNVELVEEMNLNMISVLEQAECFYFKTPARRSN